MARTRYCYLLARVRAFAASMGSSTCLRCHLRTLPLPTRTTPPPHTPTPAPHYLAHTFAYTPTCPCRCPARQEELYHLPTVTAHSYPPPTTRTYRILTDSKHGDDRAWMVACFAVHTTLQTHTPRVGLPHHPHTHTQTRIWNISCHHPPTPTHTAGVSTIQ